MRSPASSTSPRAPSKPTWPASCASSAPETASSSPCGPTRPDASDTAKAPPPFAAPPQRHVALRPARPASPSTSRRRPTWEGLVEDWGPGSAACACEDHPDKTKPGPPLFAVAPAFRQLDPGISPRPQGWVVEVAGIEPASYDASPGLLRAQSAVSLLGPTDRTDKPV